MAKPDGPTTDSLIAELAAAPFDFDFYAAARLIQSRFPDLPRLGYSSSISQDPVRFAQGPGLDFAPATLEAMQRKDPQHPPRIYCRHFGLFGPNGPMPLCFTEYVRDRVLHYGDSTLAGFCNLFHHRMLAFFFRAWADAHKAVDFDRPQAQRWWYFLGSLAGLGMDSLRSRDSVPDRAKVYFTGRLAQQVRNAEGLEAILQDFFGVQTEVETFVGRWIDLPPDSICRLGQSRTTGSLGTTAIVGSRVWSCQLHFRLRMGPMKYADLARLLPARASYRRLGDWIRGYAGDEFTWDLQLVLAKEEVPQTSLGRAGRLGWTTWLKTQPFTKDATDLVLMPHN
ncbi:MAG: type VI secretion system baseplate subunit TssG [Verrucomicrobiota bacterium]